MHTTEHILNQTMIRMFKCARSKNVHIERKKSKADYILDAEPTPEQIQAIENKVNEVIRQNLLVTVEYMSQAEAASIVDLSKLPENATDTLRIVRVGDYDVCACAGTHVGNTSEIGEFKILNCDYEAPRWRMRFKLIVK